MDSKLFRREVIGEEVILKYQEQPIEVFERPITDFKKLGATHIGIWLDRDFDGIVENIEFEPIKYK